MEFAKVTAIIRNEMVENVEVALEKAGVSGFTVTNVKGVGEWEKKFSFFAGPSTHCKIEIFTEENRAEQIAGVIMDAAHTGSVGDGLVAVLPVHKVFRIRTKTLAKSGEV
ncbi:MAG: P-II family nitrogen regulator [Acidobacteriia bacterium]|nr:P-II family nitrogen regulator [Terriglobia bacterium]